MGQVASGLDVMDDDGPDIFSLLEDLFQCFGMLNMFAGSNKRRKKRSKREKMYNGFQQEPLYTKIRYTTDEDPYRSSIYYDTTGREGNTGLNTDNSVIGVLKPDFVLGKTGSTIYEVEVIQPDTYQKWRPKHKVPKSKVIIQLEPLAEVWTMWQQVNNDLCVFGIPTKVRSSDGTEQNSFLYVTVVTLPVQVNNSRDELRVVRLMPALTEPIKNDLEPDDPRLFKMDYLEKSGNRKLFHIASLSYLGIENNDLCLTDSRHASVWEVKEHAVSRKKVRKTAK